MAEQPPVTSSSLAMPVAAVPAHESFSKEMKTTAAIVIGLALSLQAHARDADQITKYLDSVIIPKIRFEDTAVEEAIDYLRQRTMELDPDPVTPERKGVSFIVRRSRLAELEGEQAAGLVLGDRPSESLPTLTISLDNVSLRSVLVEIARQAHLDIHITTGGVLMCPSMNDPFPNKDEQSHRVLSTIYRYKTPNEEKKKENKSEMATPRKPSD